jgi:hypothetical protein
MNRNRLRSRIRWGVIRAHDRPGFRAAYRTLCRWGTLRVGAVLGRLSGVEAVYLRHSHPWSESFVPAHSDLDLTVVLREEAAEDPARIEAIASSVRGLARLHPYVEENDVRLTTREDLARLTRDFSAPVEILYRPEDWRRLHGEEVRAVASRPFPPARLPWQPEFHKWWSHHLQNRLYERRGGPEGRYLRPIYRDSLKNQLHLAVASGSPVRESGGPVRDDLPRGIFAPESTGLEELLAGIRHRRFWSDEPTATTERVVYAVLREVRAFVERTVSSDTSSAVGRAADEIDPGEPGDPALADIGRDLVRRRDLSRHLEGVFVCPPAFPRPDLHLVELLLPDDLPEDRFRAVVASIREHFGSRCALIGGRSCQLTLRPICTFRDPRFLLGTSTPFLAEHFLRFGRTVHGPDLRSAWRGIDREEWRRWCAVFLPFHQFNYRRHLDPASRAQALREIAVVRRFLESGRIDGGDREPAEVPRAIGEASFEALGREYDAVEASLRGAGAVAS